MTLNQRYIANGIILICTLMTTSHCSESSNYSTPRPRAYPKVVYPEKSYQAFEMEACGFQFDYPSYAEIQKDASSLENEPEHPCWFDIYFPLYDCRIHCSYFGIGGEKQFEDLKHDAFELVDWHKKKANYIEEITIQTSNGISGFAFEIQGPAASPYQFYLTDSTTNFLRGALYFNTQARPDSLAPVYAFIKKDVVKIIESFKWQN